MKIPAINTSQTFKANEQPRQNQQQTKKTMHFHPLPTTGWIAAGAFGVTMISGMMHKPLIHKLSAVVGVAATAAHIGIATSHHHNRKKDIVA